MSKEIPAEWKTDNLFVLIGGNPLPNYVAAQLLLKEENGILHLVHSPDTANISNQLCKHFPGNFKEHTIQDPADHGGIKLVIEDALKNHCKDGSIGLHYTGGTKAMAVHVYQVLNSISSNVVFTYLDARTQTLRCDDDKHPVEIKYHTTPKVQTLFELHDIALTNSPEESPQPLFPDLEKALAMAHSSSEGAVAYDHWCRRYIRTQTNKIIKSNAYMLEEFFALAQTAETSDEFKHEALIELRASDICQSETVEKLKQFAENPIPFPKHPKLAMVADAMREAFGVEENAFSPQALVGRENENAKFKKIEHLVDYLDGIWMEYWTLAALLSNQTSAKLQDITMSLETRDRLDFEFDVAAMQGYQLYAVSCTRSNDSGLCKKKLFEAFIRATQMGGDEARIGLVCAYSKPTRLQKQVAEVWRTDNNRMKVFGAGVLGQLQEEFAEWLDS